MISTFKSSTRENFRIRKFAAGVGTEVHQPLSTAEIARNTRIKIEDDGSLASRGNVLLTVYERTGNVTILIHVKLYHYACVYNNWYSYAEDKACYE
ncbi:hypothetical protein ANCDUO_08769 [Ancylostoma duodenale]|uniref:Uncharacterized protein n=1 Tax=Ancylostoma duodenale TaxID=51022 RepID=A0A0C2GV10_9BILA|nr:hypothetical protein ANCDUO_08769 [Ancylostoma duodenale]